MYACLFLSVNGYNEEEATAVREAGDDFRLFTSYAATKPEEGFAEFIRMYVTGGPAERKWLEQTCPECWKYLRNKGIIAGN
jgi:hypothetical protein